MNLHFQYSTIITPVWEAWSSFAKNDIFLQREFHLAIEKTPPDGITPYYCIIKNDEETIGICYFQLKKLKMAEALKVEKEGGITTIIKKTMLNWINFYSLVCGNSMVTGQYGYRFKKSMSRADQYEIAVAAANELVAKLKRENNINVGPILLKDYFDRQLYPKTKLENFTQFTVQPCMILELDSEWKSFDDYLAAMRTKYRTRAKRAIKKLEPISVKEMDNNNLEKEKDTMYAFYLSIAKEAGFNLFFLDVNYFQSLKNYLQGNLKIIGYYLEGQLVGFYTFIINGDHVDAHFLGYDKQLNSGHQLYQNMLYNMVDQAIQHKLTRIFMSRTAMEIKSSTGAEAHEMYCYLKHTKPFINKFIPRILTFLVPKEDWIPRSPFKADSQD